MSVRDIYSQIVGWVPQVPPMLLEDFVNQAWRNIRDAKLWSFLQEDCGVFCPVQITTGTVAIEQFSNTVVCDADASAALEAISLPSPLNLTNLQIRFGGTGNAAQTGQVYSIANTDNTTPAALELTLDRVVMQATNAESGYQLYRAYIVPTVDDFLSWSALVDMTNGWGLWLNRSSGYFDAMDPQRTSQGMAYYCGAFKGRPTPDVKPQYELWPHCTSGQTFYGRFRRQGTNFLTPKENLPPLVPEDLIVNRALGYYVYPWAASQVGKMPELKGVNYPSLVLDAKRAYQEGLLRLKRNDDEQELSTVWNRGHGLVHSSRGNPQGMPYPIDAKFLQGHLINL